MRLTYRGASYEYNNSPLEVREGAIFNRSRDAQQRCQTLQERSYPLIYRGVQYNTNQVAASLLTPAPQAPQSLIYRGTKYIKNPDGSIQLERGMSEYTVPKTTLAATKEISRVHRENLRRNLDRRLQSAKARGDQSLISLLEAESRELAL